jgi:selenocysteine-specific elongation factor
VTGTGWLRVTTADVRLSHAFATEHATLHIGAASVPVRVRVIGLDGRHARLQLAQAAPLEIGDRGLLRDPSSRAVAGVAVLDVEPPAFMRRGEPVHRAQQLERVPELTTADDLVAWRGVIASEGLAAMGLETATSAKQVGDYVIAPERWRQWTTALTQLLMVDPAGVSEGEVVTQLGLPDRQLLPELCDAADAVTNRGRVRRRGAPDVELPDEINAVERRLRANPFDALDLATLQALGLNRKALGAAVAAQRLVRIAPDIYLLPDAPTQAVRRLRELPDEFTVSEARQALDSTRRVVVPLLEHLDATGRTRRVDATRRRLVHNAGQDEEDIGTA